MNIKKKLDFYQEGLLTYNNIIESLQGWFGYAMWANTYNYRKNTMKTINSSKGLFK